MPASPRKRIQWRKDRNAVQPILRLPDELHLMWTAHLASPADVFPTDPGYVDPQTLNNLRKTCTGLRDATDEIILIRNFEYIEVKLESRVQGSGDIDELLRKMHDFRHCGDGAAYVKRIRFRHHQSQNVTAGNFYPGHDLSIPLLSLPDFFSLRAQLIGLLNTTPKLRTLIIYSPPSRANDASLSLPIHLLGQMTPVLSARRSITLERIELMNVNLQYNYLQSCLDHHVPSLKVLNLSRVRLISVLPVPMPWSIIVRRLRNNGNALRSVFLNMINGFPPGAAGGPDYARFIPHENETFTVPANNNAQEEYHLIGPGNPTWMSGQVGVRLGLNRMLQRNGSALYDPTQTVTILRNNGTIV